MCECRGVVLRFAGAKVDIFFGTAKYLGVFLAKKFMKGLAEGLFGLCEPHFSG